MSKTLMIHHLVFCTKHRQKTLTPDYRRELYAFLYNIFKQKDCWVYRINGMPDHVHILFDLHPKVAMADLVRTLKTDSNKFLTDNEKFINFRGWGTGYYAASVSPTEKDSVIEYIIGQRQHHIGRDFLDEIEEMLIRNGMQWHNDDWE